MRGAKTQEAIDALRARYGTRDVRRVGEGFFGEVFAVRTTACYHAVKLFKLAGVAKREADELSVMAKLGVRCPKVFGIGELNGRELLETQFIDGATACELRVLSPKKRALIGEKIVDEAGKMRFVGNIGFGKLGGETFPTWASYYRTCLSSVEANVEAMASLGELDAEAASAVALAERRFDDVFCEAPAVPSFIHGDLNPQNVMVDTHDLSVYVIDPVNSFWGDNECELYQMKAAGGTRYKLIERYEARFGLSRGYALKEKYYSALGETAHLATIASPKYRKTCGEAAWRPIFSAQKNLAERYLRELKKSLT